MPVQTLNNVSVGCLQSAGSILIVGGFAYNYEQHMRDDPRVLFWWSDDLTSTRSFPATVKVVLVLRAFLSKSVTPLILKAARSAKIDTYDTTVGEVKKLYDRVRSWVPEEHAPEPKGWQQRSYQPKQLSVGQFVARHIGDNLDVSHRIEGKRLARMAGRLNEVKSFIAAVKALREQQIRGRFAGQDFSAPAVELRAVETSELVAPHQVVHQTAPGTVSRLKQQRQRPIFGPNIAVQACGLAFRVTSGPSQGKSPNPKPTRVKTPKPVPFPQVVTRQILQQAAFPGISPTFIKIIRVYPKPR